MPSVNRLPSIARNHLIPLVIGALVLRALIPVGFMPGPSGATSLAAMMCASPASGAVGLELIEIPGGMPASGHEHCDFCALPMLGSPLELARWESSAAIEFRSRPGCAPAHPPRFALERAQTPRAPPLA